jgi:hypothetical protein
MKYRTDIFSLLLTICLLFEPVMVFGFTVNTDSVEISCNEDIKIQKLHCNYRLIYPEPVLKVSAQSGDLPFAVTNVENYPWNGAITAILLLVDTSDPARENVIIENKKDIKILLGLVNKNHRIGLASFDKTLRLEVPFGLSAEQIANAIEKLHAIGKTTELYRSILSAIYLLKNIEADRKIIYLFSDGLAEDKAYYHNDVVNAAKDAGIVITSLGYPRSVSQSVGLQTIRRLSEETGGVFIESDNNYDIPEITLHNLFTGIDNGARFDIDIAKLYSMKSGSNLSINLTIETGSNNYQISIPFTVPGITSETAKVEKQVTAPEMKPPARTIQVITKESPEKPLNPWFWYGIPAFLTIVLIITLVVFLVITYQQGRKKHASDSGITEFKPYAYLVLQDETKKRYPITRTTWRIGRGKDNEMTLKDSSISRRHAEIHREKGDIFTLYDLESLNGVYVNNNKVSKVILHEGDIIEIGDINFRFTLLSSEYTMEESTIMQNTRAPITH